MNSENNYNTSSQRFRMPICDKTINTEISGDYTLPDYQAEIRKVLRVGVSILPPTKFISGNSAEFGGVVDYDLVYVGADGGIYSAPLSTEYGFTAPLEISSDFDLNEGVITVCKINDDTTTARVSAPRRLSIKCRLSARVKAYGMMVAGEATSDEASPESIERLFENASIEAPLTLAGEMIELSAQLPIASDTQRVAGARGMALVNECSIGDGYLDYSGEVQLSLLVCDDENSTSAQMMQKKIPFSDRIACEELNSECRAQARAHVSDISINVGDSAIICTVNVIPDITAHKSEELRYTRDLYSTERECETSYKTYALPSLIGAESRNFSQSERIPLADTSIQHGSRIVDMTCKPYVEKAECDKGRHIITGGAKYSILLDTNGEFSSYDLTLPFKYETAATDKEVAEYDTDLQLLSTLGRIESGNLCIDTEFSINTLFMGKRDITSVCDVSFGDELGRSANEIIICYPAPDDTVWSVAKKYAVPVKKISSMANYVLINS